MLPNAMRSVARRLLRRAGMRRSLAYEEQFSEEMDLPHFGGRPRFFLIATTPRCGSHFLGHALIECRHFGVPLEYLNPGNLAAWNERFGTRSTEELFGRLVTLRSGATGWFGLKAHWSQFEPYASGALFGRFGNFDRAIWIYRRDLLAQAISYLKAQQTGQWIGGAPQAGSARYDYRGILSKARTVRAQNAAWRDWFAGEFAAPLRRVVYEDLIADRERQLAAVADFLDPQAEMRPAASQRTQRQSAPSGDGWRERFLANLRAGDAWVLDPQSW